MNTLPFAYWLSSSVSSSRFLPLLPSDSEQSSSSQQYAFGGRLRCTDGSAGRTSPVGSGTSRLTCRPELATAATAATAAVAAVTAVVHRAAAAFDERVLTLKKRWSI